MDTEEIRWKQRFSNFSKAFKKLETSVRYLKHQYPVENDSKAEKNADNILNDLIKQGLIQSFESTHELAWNVIKDYAAYQGNPEIRGSRDAAREGFAMGLIQNGEIWMEMIKSRNETPHTYDEVIAAGIFFKIINEYVPAFNDFKIKMEGVLNEK